MDSNSTSYRRQSRGESHDLSCLPEVSYIMPARNVSLYVEWAIRSAQNQTVKNIEIIVVDDASDDDTAKRISALAETDPRISLIALSKPTGPSAARNIAIARARAKWVGVLDADDFITSDRTESLLNLANHFDSDIVADNLFIFDDLAQKSTGHLFETDTNKCAYMLDPTTFLNSNHMFSKRRGLGYLKPIFKVDFLIKTALAYDENVQNGEDFLFVLTCLLRGAKFLVASKPQYFYRVRTNSTSGQLHRSHLVNLIDAYSKMEIEIYLKNDPNLAKASLRYGASLKRALAFTDLVEAVKANELRRAALIAFQNPQIISLVRRFGLEAIEKRLGRIRRGAFAIRN
jgi:succinoglycan biosynthesis protein ExoO